MKKITLEVSPIQLGFLAGVVSEWIKLDHDLLTIPNWILDLREQLFVRFDEAYEEGA